MELFSNHPRLTCEVIFVKARFLLVGICLAAMLSGCAPETAIQPDKEFRAVYFAPRDGGSLSKDDLAAHPEIAVVHTMQEVKQAAANGTPVWVDRAAADDADAAWLRALESPVAVLGCGDGLYAFASLLGFPIEVPEGAQMDEEAQGFCVWASVTEKSGFVSQRMKGYKDTPVTANEIFSAMDEVLGE